MQEDFKIIDFFNVIGIIVTIICGVMAIVHEAAPSADGKDKTIIYLAVAVFCLLLISIFQYIKYKTIQYKRKNHKALIKQFDEKKEENKRYREAIELSIHILHTALSNSKETSLANVYNAICSILETIKKNNMK